MIPCPDVCFVAGWGETGAALSVLTKAVPDDFTYCSTSHAELGGYADRDAIIDAFLATVGAPRIVVGHSLGALIALDYAARFPDHCERLVLLSGTSCFLDRPGYRGGVQPARLRNLRRRVQSSVLEALTSFFEEAASPAAPPAEFLGAAQTVPHASLLDGLSYLQDADLRRVLSEIECPVLLLHGSEDRVIPWQASASLHDSLPVSIFRYLPGAGHLAFLDCPDEVTSSVRRFLSAT